MSVKGKVRERGKERQEWREEKRGRGGEEEKGRKGEGERGERRRGESRTGRLTRGVIRRLSFIFKAGLISFCLHLNEIGN